ALLRDDVDPGEIAWREVPVGTNEARHGPSETESAVRVPRAFVELARGVAIHRDPARWALLYEVLWRLTHEGRALMEQRDPTVEPLARLETGVRENRAVTTAGPCVREGASLDSLRTAAARCAGCALSRHASQTVFGRGPADARIALVGEQPGDQ